MKTVWKFPLELKEGPQEAVLPSDADLLHFGFQGTTPTIWALVDPDVKFETTHTFHIVGTGWPLQEGSLRHRGTAIVGAFVWHLFDEPFMAMRQAKTKDEP